LPSKGISYGPIGRGGSADVAGSTTSADDAAGSETATGAITGGGVGAGPEHAEVRRKKQARM
jgi:hypothetical protein